MLFAEFDLGDILRRETGSKTPSPENSSGVRILRRL
jgi:hypothetical protein